MKGKNKTAQNFSDVVELGPVPDVDDDDGVFVQEIFQGLGWNSQNFSRSFLKPRLHEQWHFQILSHLTDFTRLSVQFCQALRPILR